MTEICKHGEGRKKGVHRKKRSMYKPTGLCCEGGNDPPYECKILLSVRSDESGLASNCDTSRTKGLPLSIAYVCTCIEDIEAFR